MNGFCYLGLLLGDLVGGFCKVEVVGIFLLKFICLEMFFCVFYFDNGLFWFLVLEVIDIIVCVFMV